MEKIGREYRAYWIEDDYGMEVAFMGLNATLRDYAMFGSLYLKKAIGRALRLFTKNGSSLQL
jgi:hypothetical protein